MCHVLISHSLSEPRRAPGLRDYHGELEAELVLLNKKFQPTDLAFVSEFIRGLMPESGASSVNAQQIQDQASALEDSSFESRLGPINVFMVVCISMIRVCVCVCCLSSSRDFKRLRAPRNKIA